MANYLPCIYAFLTCAAFSVMLEVKRLKIIISCALTGCIGWFVYLVFQFVGDDTWGVTIRFFIATIVVAVLAEVFARIHKTPATLFLIIGIIPMVPGGGIYYTMEALLNGNMQQFVSQGIKTAASAGAIAGGCSLVSSIVRMVRK